jgi:Fur family transcriptional regulator, iron response regulator
MTQNSDASIYTTLAAAGLRPTQQRVLLARLLFTEPCRHVTAETLHREAIAANANVSLATVYNTLHQFTEAKLLREVCVEDGATYFDTNTTPHHHFLHEETGALTDIPEDMIKVSDLPPPPHGTSISRVDVVVRVSGALAAYR